MVLLTIASPVQAQRERLIVRAEAFGITNIVVPAGTTVLRRAIFTRGSDEVADLTPGNVGSARLGLQWLF